MMRKFFTLISTVICGVSLFAVFPVLAETRQFETQKGPVEVRKIADGLDTPWAMAMLPDGNLVVTERDGAMVLVEVDSGQKKEVRNVPEVWARGQGGLLDVVLDPGFDGNRLIYFTFSQGGLVGGGGTAIASARLETDAEPRLEDINLLFSMDKKDSSGYHFGSRIVPDGQGNLFFTIGDRGTRERAQDPFDAAGSVLRITTEGGIPADNPFADGSNGLPEIWSIGHRNPQGATWNQQSGKLWTLAHGAKGGDEINIPQAGKNYGWPVVSYGVHYSGQKIGIGSQAPGFEQPIYYWDPSIAPSGMDFYDGYKVSFWNGDLFVGALKFQTVVRLETDGERIVSEERLFQGEYGRIRDVRSFNDGALWFLTDDSNGAIYRVSEAQ